ncbi:MAG: hypothetical protein ABIX11_12250 [Casimicrobiaceae bacterium]
MKCNFQLRAAVESLFQLDRAALARDAPRLRVLRPEPALGAVK